MWAGGVGREGNLPSGVPEASETAGSHSVQAESNSAQPGVLSAGLLVQILESLGWG